MARACVRVRRRIPCSSLQEASAPSFRPACLATCLADPLQRRVATAPDPNFIWQQLQVQDEGSGDQSLPASVCAAVSDLGHGSHWQQAIELLQLVCADASLGQEHLSCFSAVASLCNRCSRWQAALGVLALPESLTPSVVTQNVLLATLGRAGHWAQALQVLCTMEEQVQVEPDLISFNTTMQALERAGKWQHVLSLLEQIPDPNGPDVRSVATAISACAKGGDWHRALSLLQLMPGQLLSPDLHCHTAMITSFQRSLSWPLGLQYLKELLATEKLDVVGYDAALGLCEAGCWEDALFLLKESQSQGCEPTVSGLCSAVTAMELSGSPSAFPHIDPLYRAITDRAMLLLAEMKQDKDLDVAIKLSVSRGVHTVLALDTLHAAGRMSQDLNKAFREIVFEPVMVELRHAVAASEIGAKLTAQHGLGIHFAREALLRLGIANGQGEEWLHSAKQTVAVALERGFPGGLPKETSARQLFTWVSYLVFQPDGAGGNSVYRSNGEIVAHGLHRWPSGSNLLRPIYSSYDRSQHSERRALLKVLQRLVHQGASSSATGTVRLFSCHTPCVSCLFVFAQFQSIFPKIRLVVEFLPWGETRTSWQQWQETVGLLLPEGGAASSVTVGWWHHLSVPVSVLVHSSEEFVEASLGAHLLPGLGLESRRTSPGQI